MILACVFCGRQGLPVVQGELPPYADATVLWTLCRLHREEIAGWGRAAEAFMARLRAAAQRERRAQAEGHEKPQEPASMQSPSSEGAGGGPLIGGRPEKGVEQP